MGVPLPAACSPTPPAPPVVAAAGAGQTVLIESAFTTRVLTAITLPAPLRWDDVAGYQVRWGRLYLVTHDQRELAFALNSADLARIAQPETVAIHLPPACPSPAGSPGSDVA